MYQFKHILFLLLYWYIAISIHLMYQFKSYTVNKIERQLGISIHLMYQFKATVALCLKFTNEFQYISCISSRLSFYFFLLHKYSYFNTSHVSVQVCFTTITKTPHYYFNTSHVSVQERWNNGRDFKLNRFQYISCISSRLGYMDLFTD